MAVGIIQEYDGFQPENYERVCAEISFPQEWPEGLISHAAGPVDGGMRLVEIWASREQFDRFIAETIQPAIERTAGAAASEAPEPRFTYFEVLRFEKR
jgi:hypothetical protein